MALRAIADELRLLPAHTAAEADLRACLANLLIGLNQSHIEAPHVKRRLERVVTALGAVRKPDFRALLRAHDLAMSAFGVGDHFHRPGPLDGYLDQQAVSIQANEDGMLGLHWLTTAERKSGVEIAAAFGEGKCAGFVGPDNRAIWLTPLIGEVADLLDKAANNFSTADDRAWIARRLVALLGLIHIKPGAEILAMVTRAPLGDLLFDRPDDRKRVGPPGSTAIEARGHRRFRAWPRTLPGPFGRTYDTDETARADAMGGDYGALEVVSPRLPMGAFEQCIYVGELSDRTVDDGKAYLGELGVAGRTAPDLLVELADVVGL